jgi:tetratricopeptide (TPR) repeat protein
MNAPSQDRVYSDPRFEPAFLDYDQGSLFPDSQGHIEETKCHLARAISRRPKALRLHIERILLLAESADPTILGALCDLFLVLGDKGVPLRRRMLALARPLLSKRDHQQLLQHILEGCDEGEQLNNLCTGAVLAQGTTGTTRLIIKQSTRNSLADDPLRAAQAQLEIGQTAQALETLEQAVLADRQRLALHQALLEIHRHLRDRSRIDEFLQRLNAQSNPAESEWTSLLEELTPEATDP